MKTQISNFLRQFVPGTYQNIYRRRNSILNTFPRKKKLTDVIVSMTTYQPRIDFFEYAVLSLLNGTVLPEKILIHVPKGFIEDLESRNTSFLQKYYGKGLIELVEMEEDYYCHSKYYYAFQKYGLTKDIILCDDDVVYYSGWLAGLYKAAEENTDYQVIAYRALNVKLQGEELAPINAWHYCSQDADNKGLLFAEAVGGVLYRRASMQKETLNKEAFLELSPKADDVWLWFCSNLNGNKVKYIKPNTCLRLLCTIPHSQASALWIENGSRNDIYIRSCLQYFMDKYGMDIRTKSEE